MKSCNLNSVVLQEKESIMIIGMRLDITNDQLQIVLEMIIGLGYKYIVTPMPKVLAISVDNDEDTIDTEPFKCLDGVTTVLRTIVSLPKSIFVSSFVYHPPFDKKERKE